MLDVLRTRLRQGHRTIDFPASLPPLPDRFQGMPYLNAPGCPQGCDACVKACPTNALVRNDRLSIDLGTCLFCAACVEACPEKSLGFSTDYKLAASRRDDCKLTLGETYRLAHALDERARKIFGHSLKLREVSAAGCNACEADVNVLNTPVWDLGRFGIQFVASPRHADGVLVTGPVSENMVLGLMKTWDAIPAPKIAIAVGACAISGGIFAGNPEVTNSADSHLPIDLYIPGCPPHPATILDGLLRLLGRL